MVAVAKGRSPIASSHSGGLPVTSAQQRKKFSNRQWCLAISVGFYLGVMVTLFFTTSTKIFSQATVDTPQHPQLPHRPGVKGSTTGSSVKTNGADQPKDKQEIVKPAPVQPANKPPAAAPTETKKDDTPKQNIPETPKENTVPKVQEQEEVQVQPPQTVSSLRLLERTTPLEPLPIASLPTPQEQHQVKQILQSTTGRSFLPLQAVVEPPLSDTKPLPIRSEVPLETFTYARANSCSDFPDAWPVDHPVSMDSVYGTNVQNLGSLHAQRHDYAKDACPVDLDPFLPWIHDSFVSPDGSSIQFVAHNKRRCRQDPAKFGDDIAALEPQVALLQSVPIQRVTKEELQGPLPQGFERESHEGWYRLSPIQDADTTSTETRFLCQFHTLKANSASELERVVLGETWSQYPYNYEHANFQHRRGQSANPMLTRPADSSDVNGIHNEQVWNAILHFSCPVPTHLQTAFAHGNVVDQEDIPSVYVDLVPVRTPPRTNLTGYYPQRLSHTTFNPVQEWGEVHLLPPVSQSGRWSNIPVCVPPVPATEQELQAKEEGKELEAPKKNYLMGCLWASAGFSVRGDTRVDTSTNDRLVEWLAYHLEVAGFDQIIVYDNSEANSNVTSLKPITDLYPDRVVRIPWKHRVCNNNHPNHPNAGERSSQYAAEASCRMRYGHTTEWLISFDTDEYLIPQSNYSTIKDWLQESVASGEIAPETNILNFYQLRGRLNYRFTEPYFDDTSDCSENCKRCSCRGKRANATFLETYCEPSRFPLPPNAARAKKQLYRPSFVLNHFVHYSTVTRMVIDRPRMPRVVGYPYERRVKEMSEAFMLHSKTKPPRRTTSWKTQCTDIEKCPLGFAWPHYQDENTTSEEGMVNEMGFPYSCYEIQKVNDVLAPKLHKALEKFGGVVSPAVSGQDKVEKSVASVTENVAAIVRGDSEAAPFVYDPHANGVNDFDPSIPGVIVSKIQGNQTLLQAEQWLCLLNQAYNSRAQKDIVLFSANPLTEEEEDKLRQLAAPAKFSLVLDNPGLDVMIAGLTEAQRIHLFQRCGVKDASELKWNTRCPEVSSQGTTNMTLQYNWQAEFRSLHMWKHPALANYKYMMWLDTDGFCTKKWLQDPIATVARYDLAILFDHFPQGMAKGKEWGYKIHEAFNRTYCRVEMENGHLKAYTGGCLGKNLQIKQVHGFFHVTNLDFFRSEGPMHWAEVMIGDSKFSRMYDDQIGVTIPSAVLAGNRSWDMRWHGLNLGVFHSYHLDGDIPFGGYLNYWKKNASTAFPEAYGTCKVTQHG
eukprot:Nitzschia sp. Nitz4//scaffold343_size17995//3209//7250//NITZ4_008797-RA/size17995-processed-gene-0.25-mRNA-1//-1//CDS//3329548584//5400//frame0